MTSSQLKNIKDARTESFCLRMKAHVIDKDEFLRHTTKILSLIDSVLAEERKADKTIKQSDSNEE